ncbi:hypothetical protein ACQ86N_04440 [Puia sp. P3]|uniref:hypothetical protein n=1 Tax=Puia sp. P3 TaxID=3423952 RepID=UPI003D6675CA
MTSGPILICISACAFLFSCQQMETSDTNTTPTDSLVVTSVYPVQPMQLVAPVGLKLSYTGRTTTDSSVFYQVMSTYNGETYGFNLSVPKKETGTAYLSSKGKASDDLLHFMQRLYGQPVDSASRMGDYIPASYSALGALIETKTDTTVGKAAGAAAGVGTAGKPGAAVSAVRSVDTLKVQKPVSLGTQNKLVFRNAAGDQAEIYLDIDEKTHLIGLMEKDSVNRAPLIRCLQQK